MMTMIEFEAVSERLSVFHECRTVLDAFPNLSYRILDVTNDGRVHLYINQKEKHQYGFFLDPEHTYVIHCKGLTLIQALAKIQEKVNCYLHQHVC